MVYPAVHAQQRPEHLAVIMEDGRTLTYRELDSRSTRLARVFGSRGLRPGDAVAILTENHPAYFEVYWAAVRSGLYVTGVNKASTAHEAAYILADASAKVLITSHQLASEALLEQLDEAGHTPHRFLLDVPDQGLLPGYEDYEALLAAESDGPLSDQPRGQLMLYSSGTTGRPKGVRRALTGLQVDDPRANRTSDLAKAIAAMDGDTRYLIPAPLYHGAALNWAIAVQELGGTLVVMDAWDPERFLSMIEQHRISHTQAVTTMMIRLLKLSDQERSRHDLSSLKVFLHAAAPCPAEVKQAMIEWLGPIVDEYYAGTEGHGVTFIRAAEALQRPGSVGRAVTGVIRICDDEGAELPIGEVGTVFFERETTPFEYHNDPDKTRDSRHPLHDTWSTIGDLGRVDDDGYLYLTDRKAFMVISGGVNIYPAEVEGAFALHPAVADVAVFGLPDEDLGERVHAVVQLEPGYLGDEAMHESLLAHARERLSRYKVPRGLDFVDHLPRMESGKIRKDEVRAPFLAAR